MTRSRTSLPTTAARVFAPLVLLALASAAPAGAETVKCTAVPRVPVTISTPGIYCLQSDFRTSMATEGSAITITASNVVLDLNGHRIANDVRVTSGALGIDVKETRNVTIRNGTVVGFGIGVALEGSSGGHVVEHVRFDQCGSGVFGWSVDGMIARRNVVVTTLGDSAGLSVEGDGNRFIDNEIVGTQMDRAIHMSGEDNLAVGNRMTGARWGITVCSKYRDNLTSGVTTPYQFGIDAGNNN